MAMSKGALDYLELRRKQKPLTSDPLIKLKKSVTDADINIMKIIKNW